MPKRPSIFVDGDRYVTGFYLRAQSVPNSREDGLDPEMSHFYPLFSGADVVADMIDALRKKKDRPCRRILPAADTTERFFLNTDKLTRVLELRGQKSGDKDKHKCKCKNKGVAVLRVDEEADVSVELGWIWGGGTAIVKSQPPRNICDAAEVGKDDILVHWIARPEVVKSIVDKRGKMKTPPECGLHIQIGTTEEQRAQLKPSHALAKPQKARVMIISPEEIFTGARIRKALSYDSIVVDILRTWRGYGEYPNPSQVFKALLGMDPSEQASFTGTVPIYIIVRITNSALLLYECHRPNRSEGETKINYEEKATLLFHKDRPAPSTTPDMGKMIAYNALIGACVACEAESGFADCSNGVTPVWLQIALERAIHLQRRHFDSGFLPLLHNTGGREPRVKNLPLFYHIRRMNDDWRKEDEERKEKATRRAKLNGFPSKITNTSVYSVPVSINEAVSHHTVWHVAHDLYQSARQANASSDKGKPDRKTKVQKLADGYTKMATSWLIDPKKTPDTDPRVAIVKIGKLRVVDRREVEDLLSLREALLHYPRDNPLDTNVRPLNVAVFGPPGSGKSFSVRQVAEAVLAETDHYDSEFLVFNLSQFAGLSDYNAAFQLVRNKCLSNKIPIVFFDEFDCAFEGRVFGWLKYFLAPMQDAAFSYGGTEFRLGRCVLIFAGGVNRSFDEFNSRIRNPSFIEAKGSDFLSRLRGHLNIRGINKPDEDDDSQLYILRRALLLHFELTERLKHSGSGAPPAAGLLDQKLAKAFCAIDHFRHGARSLGAIMDMCDTKAGHTLGPSDLPAMEQLDMHVDAAKFLKYVYEE